MDDRMSTGDWKGTTEAAKIIGVTRRCIQRLAQQNKVLRMQILDRVLVEMGSVQAYFSRTPSEHTRGRKPKPQV